MRHWTEQTDAEAAEYFPTLSEKEIRRRQDLCQQQIQMAYEQRKADALEDLYRMEQALANEMLRRLDLGLVS